MNLNISHVIEELTGHRDKLNAAIETLKSLDGPRRGRPRKEHAAPEAIPARPRLEDGAYGKFAEAFRERRGMSAEGRERISKAAKAMWKRRHALARKNKKG